MEANETTEVANFSAAVSAIERTHDFVAGRYARERAPF